MDRHLYSAFGAHVDAPRRRAAARQPARAELRRRRGRVCRRAPAGLVRPWRRVAAQGAADPRPARQEHDARRDAAARIGARAGRPGAGTAGAAARQADLRRPQLQGPRGRKQHGGAEVPGDLLEVRDLGHRRAQAHQTAGGVFAGGLRGRTGRCHRPPRQACAGRQGVGLRAGLHEPERRQRSRPAVCRRAVATRQVVRHLRAHRPGHRHARRRRQPARARESACG